MSPMFVLSDVRTGARVSQPHTTLSGRPMSLGYLLAAIRRSNSWRQAEFWLLVCVRLWMLISSKCGLFKPTPAFNEMLPLAETTRKLAAGDLWIFQVKLSPRAWSSARVTQ